MTAPPDVAKVIRRLVEIRYQRGLSQQDVAERMGCDRSNIGQFERCKQDARLSTVLKYARAIGVRLVAEILVELPGGDLS